MGSVRGGRHIEGGLSQGRKAYRRWAQSGKEGAQKVGSIGLGRCTKGGAQGRAGLADWLSQG